MHFLTAFWKHLLMINYSVEPEVLLPYLPYGTRLDLWNGKAIVSLVGFQFNNTKLKGCKVPFHVNFEEVNLRFYVIHDTEEGPRRGVTFIREIVPSPLLALVANEVYKEHYSQHAMQHSGRDTADALEVAYAWKQHGKWNSMGAIASPQSQAIVSGSEEEFIAEHYFGYTRVNDQDTYEYEIEHPRWKLFPVHETFVDIDFNAFGPAFASLNDAPPESALLAEGSEVTVRSKHVLDTFIHNIQMRHSPIQSQAS